MIFKKKGKGGLETLNSLVSTRLKEADASETEDDMSTEDASNEIVPLSPRAFSQTSSEDSASYRSIDRYGLYFARSDISEGASEASSHNFWKKKLRDSFDEAENHSFDTIVKRGSFSDKPCILKFENDESAKLISTPEDFVVAKRFPLPSRTCPTSVFLSSCGSTNCKAFHLTSDPESDPSCMQPWLDRTSCTTFPCAHWHLASH
jgi:hypothetical protein